jgi:hypothetical protein
MGADRPLPSFSRKRVDEDLKLTFDFSNDIASGETISTATTTAAVWSGTDANPNDIVSGSASISGAKVTQLIINGTDGVTYLLKFRVVTDQSQTINGMSLLDVGDTESEDG